MPTFYQRLKEYQRRSDAVTFSKKKLKKISGAINHVWDSREQKLPLVYVQSHEGDKVYEVRNYPPAFTKTIDGIIQKFHENYVRVTPKRLRPRKPVRKPIYSTRKAS